PEQRFAREGCTEGIEHRELSFWRFPLRIGLAPAPGSQPLERLHELLRPCLLVRCQCPVVEYQSRPRVTPVSRCKSENDRLVRGFLKRHRCNHPSESPNRPGPVGSKFLHLA